MWLSILLLGESHFFAVDDPQWFQWHDTKTCTYWLLPGKLEWVSWYIKDMINRIYLFIIFLSFRMFLKQMAKDFPFYHKPVHVLIDWTFVMLAYTSMDIILYMLTHSEFGRFYCILFDVVVSSVYFKFKKPKRVR